RVDEEELAGGILAEGGDGADDLQRGEAAHHPGERAEHALFGTADAGAVGILADEAAIAGPVCLPAAEHAELAFELRYRGRDERDAVAKARVGNGEACGEIVAAVEDDVRMELGDQRVGIARVDPLPEAGERH